MDAAITTRSDDRRGYRIAEAARYMGVSPWFVELKIRSGELPALRLCRHYTVLKEDMDEFLSRARTALAEAQTPRSGSSAEPSRAEAPDTFFTKSGSSPGHKDAFCVSGNSPTPAVASRLGCTSAAIPVSKSFAPKVSGESRNRRSTPKSPHESARRAVVTVTTSTNGRRGVHRRQS
jgi:excisionase family DNA binding protein